MIPQTVSKSQFKAQALEYLRLVQSQKQSLIITHNGKSVVEVIPYKEKQESDPEAILQSLRGTLVYYKGPNEPAISPDEWEALK